MHIPCYFKKIKCNENAFTNTLKMPFLDIGYFIWSPNCNFAEMSNMMESSCMRATWTCQGFHSKPTFANGFEELSQEHRISGGWRWQGHAWAKIKIKIFHTLFIRKLLDIQGNIRRSRTRLKSIIGNMTGNKKDNNKQCFRSSRWWIQYNLR